jgi:hypothetical protein
VVEAFTPRRAGLELPAAPQQARPTPTGRAVKNGPLALITGSYSDRIVLIGPRGRFFRSLPICRPPKCGELQSAAWSPDGRTLAYGTASGADWHPQDGLHLFDLARNKDRRLPAGYGNWQDLAWSPDGTRLAYVIGANIEIIRIAQPQRPTELRASATSRLPAGTSHPFAWNCLHIGPPGTQPGRRGARFEAVARTAVVMNATAAPDEAWHGNAMRPAWRPPLN